MVIVKKKVRRTLHEGDSFEDILKLIRPAGGSKKHLKWAFYSKPGMGKTTLAGTWPKVLLLDCNEKGTLPLDLKKAKNVHIIEVKNWPRIDRIYKFLRAGKHDFTAVAIDTVTSLAGLGMRFVLKEAVDRDLNRDPNMPDRRDWGKLAELVKGAILNYRNLPMDVIFLFAERSGKSGEDEDIEEVGPEIQPAVKSMALGAFDIIGRLYVKEVGKKGEKEIQRRLLVGPSDKYITKDRSGRLGRIVLNPTYRVLHDKIYGGQSNGEEE